jgi:hypothetical protein
MESDAGTCMLAGMRRLACLVLLALAIVSCGQKKEDPPIAVPVKAAATSPFTPAPTAEPPATAAAPGAWPALPNKGGEAHGEEPAAGKHRGKGGSKMKGSPQACEHFQRCCVGKRLSMFCSMTESTETSCVKALHAVKNYAREANIPLPEGCSSRDR